MKKHFFFLLISLSLISLQSVVFAFGEPAPPNPTIDYGKPSSPVTEEAELVNKPTEESVMKTVEDVKPEPEPEPVAEGGKWHRVRVGLYSKMSSAVYLKGKLEREGYYGFLVQQSGFWRVQVGAFKEKTKAETLEKILLSKGYTVDIVISD